MSEHVRLSRAEQRQRTRTALVEAAARAFARDGYHGASLEAIATSAGYSKGAVYSNFQGKAELFVAVIDLGMTLRDQQPTSLWDAAEDPGHTSVEAPTEDWNAVGIALATLEFVTAAVRDPRLAPLLAERMQRLVAHFTAVAHASRSDDDPLAPEHLAILLTALDQGLGLLYLVPGLSTEDRSVAVEPGLWTAGLRRLADPARAGYTLPERTGAPAHAPQRDRPPA